MDLVLFEDAMKRFSVITRYEGLRTTDPVVMDNLDKINPWSREGIEGGRGITRAEFDAEALAVHERAYARYSEHYAEQIRMHAERFGQQTA